MKEKFITKFKELFFNTDLNEITEKTNFKDLQEWDSLTALSLIALMDSEFCVKLSGESLNSICTVEQLILFLDE
jgi:acyl carrier protein